MSKHHLRPQKHIHHPVWVTHGNSAINVKIGEEEKKSPHLTVHQGTFFHKTLVFRTLRTKSTELLRLNLSKEEVFASPNFKQSETWGTIFYSESNHHRNWRAHFSLIVLWWEEWYWLKYIVGFTTSTHPQTHWTQKSKYLEKSLSIKFYKSWQYLQ